MPRSAAAQVEHWMRFQEILERVAREPAPDVARGPSLGPFVTVSRQAESGGGEIARRLAERLEWGLYDRKLVEGMAERLHVAPQFMNLLDETRTHWFREALLELLDARLVHQDVYVERIGRLMLLAAWEGRAVLVGRGAHLLLPPETGLRVRIVAPPEERARRLAARDGLEVATARRQLDELDDRRADWLRRSFRHADLAEFDLVVDSSRLGFDGCVNVIITGLRARNLFDDSTS